MSGRFHRILLREFPAEAVRMGTGFARRVRSRIEAQAGQISERGVIRVLKRDPSAMVCLLLVVLTWGIYAQVANFEFVKYDDDRLVFEHPVIREGLSRESVGWAFTAVVWANWTPLAWLSHMLDVEMFGLDAGGHHVTNALLHVLNTLLLFWVLRYLTGAVWRSGFVAALFAVHPLHVESVVWISERRDVLSTAFGLLSLWAYAHWTRSGRWLAYAMSFACLGFGLMSKPILVTLPLLFLLVDYWPLQRLRFGRALGRGDRADSGTANRLSTGALVIEKLPLFALVATISLVTFLSQSGGGSVVTVLRSATVSRTHWSPTSSTSRRRSGRPISQSSTRIQICPVARSPGAPSGQSRRRSSDRRSRCSCFASGAGATCSSAGSGS